MNVLPQLPPLVEDLSLAYRLRPASGEPAGLVVLLHGVGSNEASLAGLAALLPASLSVALVRSPIPMGPASFSAFAVNFTASGPVIDADAAEASRVRLLAFIAELQARTGIAPGKTVVAGFSQGGIMSAGAALTRPQAVRGFAILSGRILPEIAPALASPEALAQLDALIVHGSFDDRLPVSWADRSHAWLKELGVRFEDRRYPAGHEVTPQIARDFVEWTTGLLIST